MAEDDDKPDLLIPWLNAGLKKGEPTAQEKRNALLSYYTSLVTRLEKQNQSSLEHMTEFIQFQKHWYELPQHALDPAALTLILQSCSAALELMPAQLKKDCLSTIMFTWEHFENHLNSQLNQFSEDQLLMCLWYFRDLGINPQDQTLNRFYKLINPGKFLDAPKNEHKIVRSMVAYAKLNMIPDQEFQSKWLAKATTNMGEFTPAQHAYALWCLARLKIEPPQEFMTAWEDRLHELLGSKKHKYSDRYLANALGACAAINAIHGLPETAEAAQIISDVINFQQCTSAEQRQVHSARQFFGIIHYDPTKPARERPSKQEDALRNAFRAAGHVDISDHLPMPVEGDRADMAFKIDGKIIFVEVDGPQHFLKQCNKQSKQTKNAGFDGRTLYKTAQTQREYPEANILRLPFHLVARILRENNPSDNVLLYEFISSAAALPTGSYYSKWKNGAPIFMAMKYHSNPALDA